VAVAAGADFKVIICRFGCGAWLSVRDGRMMVRFAPRDLGNLIKRFGLTAPQAQWVAFVMGMAMRDVIEDDSGRATANA
jgi:hypothetical protein